MRIGHGYDVHKLVVDRKLIMGGVTIPHEMGLLGHSDADVLIHAIIDALIGSVGLGDIGLHFPDNNDKFKDANSMNLLRETVNLITTNGYRISNLDCTIIAEQPKFRPYIDDMKNNIAMICSIPVDCVNVKATTEEGLGFTGNQEGIAAHCVCLVCNI